jgi:hypothetical protein
VHEPGRCAGPGRLPAPLHVSSGRRSACACACACAAAAAAAATAAAAAALHPVCAVCNPTCCVPHRPPPAAPPLASRSKILREGEEAEVRTWLASIQAEVSEHLQVWPLRLQTGSESYMPLTAAMPSIPPRGGRG